MTAPADKQVTGTQAIDRACDLLVRVMTAEDPQTLTELVAATGLAKGTTSRILSALERSGLLARSPLGGFEPGPVLNNYAIQGGAYAALIESMNTAMENVAHITHETVNLAVPGRLGVDSIAQVEGSYLLGSRNWVGESVPSHCSAAGKVLLAYGAATLPDLMTSRTSETITDINQLERQLRQVRERGYAVIRNELEPGLVAVSVPVSGPNGKVIAAMSVTAPTDRIKETDEVRIASVMAREVAQSYKPEHEGAA